MSDINKSENFFYDSDEDVAWGPRTFREIKRDLKREKILPSNYRRQTASFIPCTPENNSEMYTIANSSHSSKDYFTANESLESNNIQSIASTTATTDTSNKFTSVQNKTDNSECLDVIALSSDSEHEDEQQAHKLAHVKSEIFSCSLSTKYNSFSSGKETSDNIICLSSSDDELESEKKENESDAQISDTSYDSFEDEQTPKVQSITNTPVKGVNYSLNQNYSLSNICEEIESAKMSRQTPKIRIIARTPVKRNTDSLNSSLINENQNANFTTTKKDISRNQRMSRTPLKQSNYFMDQEDNSVTRSHHENSIVTEEGDISNDEIAVDTPEKQLKYSSDKFYYRDHFLAEDEKLVTPMTKRQIPKINIISNTPIKGPCFSSEHDSDNKDLSSFEDFEKSKLEELSHQSEDCIEIGKELSEVRNTSESLSSNAQNTSIDEHQTASLNTSLHKLNLSQKENAYDYCEEVNHTLSSKLEMDLSLKNSDEVCKRAYDSVISEKHDLSGIYSLPTNSSDDTRNDSLNSNESNNIQDESMDSKRFHNIDDDSMSYAPNLSCLNDTFAEMERLLSKGFDSDSDDSSEEIIDSTSCNHPRPAFGNSSIQNISRIPVPKSFSEDSKSNSSIRNEFKIPKLPSKVIKKIPVNRLVTNKTSPLPLKNIVSPVRLYINNSPVAALKQNNKPACTKSQRALYGISESTISIPKKRRNLLDSLPEVLYKPSKLVREQCDDQIILPNNIRKLITERIVIKHEPRRRINPDESMYSVGDKLAMRDLSVIVSDEQNMSVHTTKQGFNL